MDITVEPDGNSREFSISIASVELTAGIHLDLPKSGVTAIVGPNNSGKSTLLRQLRSHIGHGTHPGFTSEGVNLVRQVQMEMSGTIDDSIAWLREHNATTEGVSGAVFHTPNGDAVGEDGVRQHLQRGLTAGIGDAQRLLVYYGDAWGRMQGAQPADQREYFSDPPASYLHILQDDHKLFDELNKISLRVFRQPLTLDRLSKRVNMRVGGTDVPAPPIDNPTKEYLSSLASLPKLMDQGDGMKSLIGLLAPLMTSTYPIIIIDEPEAFLHPPQAAALGKILGEQAGIRGIQVILATHDRNLLAGLLESEVDISIVHLSRSADDVTSADQLNVGDLRTMWNDPVLRYSNVLDGLFHRLVVLAEGDRDCRFYAAALEVLASDDSLPFPSSDVLFVPSGGKAGMPRLARVLRSVNVPVAASPDLDVLNSREMIKSLVESIGGDWRDFEQDYAQAAEPFRQPRDQVTIGQVITALNAIFSSRSSETFTPEAKKDFAAQIRAKESPWSAVKNYGQFAFKGQAAVAASRLLERLDALGIVAVRVGELEGFAPTLGVAKGPEWLPAALGAGAHKEDAAQRHVTALAKTLGAA
ncbi:ATP-dependent nuclease [Streptomyces scabiei]|uniref:ATP-dependent nuclease n=1 Tax=Streptomyces scabiei TaxID=1930 RepID=UPI0029B6AD6E|nr:AAA family ATPase [Streptomyces scabiei]MDX3519864.1 AAA family ATPase [Streptomyces scabiei]